MAVVDFELEIDLIHAYFKYSPVLNFGQNSDFRF